MFTKKEKELLLELICNEQIKNFVVKNQYQSDRYTELEELKVKIRSIKGD